ncbi:ceramide synthase 5-like isoform X2 [Ruditapes philippinarum]|uniref:ceramide synthase 5-like isoform X2 n=1 Tax=Ruditapes philippinarum TaxID=129788 RepID=UPI00295AA9A8|nr:ceramide synthase 5-like isoform X2 [Ruditapes philippinarum]
MNSIEQFIWSETFWFPEGYTWKDMENVPGSNIYLPNRNDMLWSIPLGIILWGVRYIFEQYLMTPIGYWCGVKKQNSADHLKPNAVLENYFQKNGITSNNNLESISKQTDMTVREVERWLRNRKAKSVIKDITKFRECGWHFTFYLGIFIYGLVVLWNKKWFWETKYCWKGWPTLDVPREIYWYYMVELSFYWCLVFSMLTEHKRKDFNQMIVHHIATILLMSFSWATNFVRIGCIVLLTHDAADFPMAAAKMMKYSGHKKACEFFLGVFIVVWVLSRLIYYPVVALYSATFEAYEIVGKWVAHILFVVLLVTLQILHLIWTYMIARIAYRSVYKNKLGDVRSDSEEDSD